MAAQRIGILHPGEMGISIAASALNNGHEVYWASEGRSAATRDRAEKYGLRDAITLANLCSDCSAILSICPPHAAQAVAEEVASHGFSGLYLDANAIAPQRAVRISELINAKDASFVDGGIIGGPAWEPGRTWLYVAGPRAAEVADWFANGPLGVRQLGPKVGQASALKMCFAAYSKGTTALMCAILSAAEQLQVREALAQHWNEGEAGFAERAVKQARNITTKAWRFAGEMDEIGATFREAGLPGGFQEAAATLYRRLSQFKDTPETPAIEEVLAALLQTER